MNIKNKNTREYKIQFVTITTIILNIVLSVSKLFVGIIANSSALISDAIHSISDVFSSFVVLIGVKFSKSELDEDHNYGHEKYESIAGIFLSFILIGTAIYILQSGVAKINLAISGELVAPDNIALYIALLSILTKELMYRYTIKTAVEVNSTALKADAWHHRSDAFSSIGSAIGILGAMFGYTYFDPLASIVIGVLIIKVALSILKESVDQVTDKAVNEEIYNKIIAVILNTDGVIKVDDLKTRIHGSKIYVDVEISVDKDLTILVAHSIAEEVHLKIESSFNDIKHCMVHVNPSI